MKSHKPQTNVLPIIVRSIANGATRVCHLDILHRAIGQVGAWGARWPPLGVWLAFCCTTFGLGCAIGNWSWWHAAVARQKTRRQRYPTARRLDGGPVASMGERSTSCPAGFCCARGWQPSTCCQASSLRPHLGHKSSKKAPTAEAMGAVACLWAYRTIIARHRPNTAPMAPQQRASTRASPP